MYQSQIKNKKGRYDRFQKKRALELPEVSQGTAFAIVKEMLGNGRVRVLTEDGTLKMARIPGSMRRSRKKTIISRNDLVMVAGRDYEDKMDIVFKYTHEEVQQLLRDRTMPDKIYKDMTESDMCRTEGAEDMILFCDEEDDNAPEDGSGASTDEEDEELDIDQI